MIRAERLRSRPLDGLRAVGVLAVMAYHFSYGHFPGGFLGVQLFFVLSGFLITTLLVEEHRATSAISLRNFYMRRVLRLAPALLLAILLCDAVMFAVPDAQITPSLSPVAANAAVLLYVANWVQAPNPGDIGALSHAWSLSVEEQFYLLWPVGLLILFSRTRRPWAWAFGLALLASVITFVALLATHAPASLYYSSSTHAVPLLLGCGAALWPKARALAPHWAAIGGAVVLAVMFLTVNLTDAWMYAGGFVIAAVACTLLVTHCASSQSPLSSLLSFSPLVAIGRISYGLYLFHFPIFLVARHLVLPHDHLRLALLMAAGVLATFTIATASYFLLEKPVLRLKDRWRSARQPAAGPEAAGRIGSLGS
jgi:peptidoglycan/LPS O-acetylase OafA/YrhL